MRVAILPAGGRQKRMAGFTDVPKHLLPMADGKVIDYSLRTAANASCHVHTILSGQSLDFRVAEHVGAARVWASFSLGSLNLIGSVSSLWNLFGSHPVLYIMPDTVFRPTNVGYLMLTRMWETKSPAFLALFQATNPQKYGMCELKGGYPFGYVTRIVDKPDEWPEGCGVAWGLISWTEPFWECIERTEGDNFSDVLNQAINDLGPIPYIMLHDYLDIGTPEDYEKAVSQGW